MGIRETFFRPGASAIEWLEDRPLYYGLYQFGQPVAAIILALNVGAVWSRSASALLLLTLAGACVLSLVVWYLDQGERRLLADSKPSRTRAKALAIELVKGYVEAGFSIRQSLAALHRLRGLGADHAIFTAVIRQRQERVMEYAAHRLTRRLVLDYSDVYCTWFTPHSTGALHERCRNIDPRWKQLPIQSSPEENGPWATYTKGNPTLAAGASYKKLFPKGTPYRCVLSIPALCGDFTIGVLAVHFTKSSQIRIQQYELMVDIVYLLGLLERIRPDWIHPQVPNGIDHVLSKHG